MQAAIDALLMLLSLAAAAWVLLLSALCIGSGCSEELTVRWWAWLAIAGAVTGIALVFPRRSRKAARLLLAVPIVVAVIATFTQ